MLGKKVSHYDLLQTKKARNTQQLVECFINRMDEMNILSKIVIYV